MSIQPDDRRKAKTRHSGHDIQRQLFITSPFALTKAEEISKITGVDIWTMEQELEFEKDGWSRLGSSKFRTVEQQELGKEMVLDFMPDAWSAREAPPELQLNKANTSDTEAPFLDLHLYISNGFVSSKIYDKRDDFDFDIVNFPFLDGDVPCSTSYGVYISQLIRFARVSSHVVDFNARNKSLTAKLLQQGYRYHKLRKTFSKFYRRHYEFVSKFSVGLKTLLHQGLSEPEFHVDLVYKFKKNVGRADFSDQFRKIIVRYKRIGYNINIMRQSACLVFNPIKVYNFASLFNCTPVGRGQTQWWPRHKVIYFSWFGPERFCLLLGPPGFNCWFSFAPVFQWCCSTPQGSPGVGRNTFLSSPHLCFIIVFICDLFVSRDDPLMS